MGVFMENSMNFFIFLGFSFLDFRIFSLQLILKLPETAFLILEMPNFIPFQQKKFLATIRFSIYIKKLLTIYITKKTSFKSNNYANWTLHTSITGAQ